MVHAQYVVCQRSATDFKTVSITYFYLNRVITAQETASKCEFLGSFYIKTTKCYNLDAYQAKKSKRNEIDLTVYRPDYRNYFSSELLYIPYKSFDPQTPLKKFRKIPKKFQAKAIQGHVPWLNLKKNFHFFFSHNMHITSEPFSSDPCARLKTQIPMHSISQGCPKIDRHCDPISLLINTFDIHLEPGCKSHEQIVHYLTAKNVKKATVLLYFQTNSSKSTQKGFPVV